MDDLQDDFWYALQVSPRKEDSVAALLSCKGYERYVPTYQAGGPVKGNLNVSNKKLFPGYVFCRFACEARNQVGDGSAVVTTPGVIRILGGAKPLPIPSEEMEAIRLALAARLRFEPWPFQLGEKVKIETGPLQGICGTIIRSDGKHRLVLSVDTLRRSVAARVQAEWISPVVATKQMIE